MTKLFTTTAGNAGFFANLAVRASDAIEAKAKFDAFVSENLDGAEEYEMAMQYSGGDLDRDDFRYNIGEITIADEEDARTETKFAHVGTAVEITHSGANG